MSTFFPPFEPDDPRDPRRRRRFRAVPFRMILPNMVTLIALAAGLTGIRMAIEGRLELAVAAILLAILLDGLDGQLARALRSTSRFGAELDSLSDFVNFGVAPAIVLYTFILNQAGSIGWIAALLFAVSGALRLARFNVSLDAPDGPAWQSNFFVGVPAPAGAGTVLLPVYLDLAGAHHLAALAPVDVVYTLLIGLLMVSRLPTISLKRIASRIRRDLVAPLFVLVLATAALAASYPWEALSVAALLYLASLPLGVTLFRRLEARAAAALKERAAGDVGEESEENELRDAWEERVVREGQGKSRRLH